jgi:hypothetical protein
MGGLGLVVAAVAVAGCDPGTGIDSVNDAMVAELAMVGADGAIEAVNTMRLPFGFLHGAVPSLRPQPGIPGGHHGLGHEGSGTVVEAFFDAGGVEQTAYDSLTTERIEAETVVDGSVSRDDWTATVHRESSITVTGLAGTETQRTFDGSGSSEHSRSRTTSDGNRSHRISESFTYEGVVVPVPGSTPRYPLAGTMRRSLHAVRTDGSTTTEHDVEMTITFDGDATAVAVVNGETFEIDLSAPPHGRPFGRGGRGPRPGHGPHPGP